MNVQAALNRHAQAAESADQKMDQVMAKLDAQTKQIDALVHAVTELTRQTETMRTKEPAKSRTEK